MSESENALRYPATLTPDDEIGGFVVTFGDIPEAITQGDNLAHALEMAAEVLECAMDFYFEDGRAIPAPSPLKPGQHFVELPTAVAARVRLLSASGHKPGRRV